MKLEEVWPALRQGSRVRNEHWDPPMFIVWQEGYPDGIAINANTARATGIKQGTIKKFRPYVMLHTVDGSFVPYVMTQSDMVSEVWQILSTDPVNPIVIGYNFDDPAPGGFHDNP